MRGRLSNDRQARPSFDSAGRASTRAAEESKGYLAKARRSRSMSRIRGRHPAPARTIPASRKGHDRLTKERRSWNMSRIKGKDTTPEKIVRSLLRSMGFRFRLNVKIPVSPEARSRNSGVRSQKPETLRPLVVRPDIILSKYKIAVFVHGCFWHRHRGCNNCTTPTHRRAWWVKKLEGNAARDEVHQRALRKLGWRSLVVWECETEKSKILQNLKLRVRKTLGLKVIPASSTALRTTSQRRIQRKNVN